MYFETSERPYATEYFAKKAAFLKALEIFAGSEQRRVVVKQRLFYDNYLNTEGGDLYLRRINIARTLADQILQAEKLNAPAEAINNARLNLKAVIARMEEYERNASKEIKHIFTRKRMMRAYNFKKNAIRDINLHLKSKEDILLAYKKATV